MSAVLLASLALMLIIYLVCRKTRCTSLNTHGGHSEPNLHSVIMCFWEMNKHSFLSKQHRIKKKKNPLLMFL